ncbi:MULTISPECIES: hypothetical protein [Halorussus]|uniref:hypothetical protein n=1 Tax=Halorussus TaxID=1070314 RepID=UPI000E218547|nr:MULTISPECIES: hypothetical protein [Halorussus]NHN58763.1 hypothetical protein [Halorussus sp. JP-T4]
MRGLLSFVFIAQTATLVAASLLLVYPVVAYARNVAYTRGLLLLASAFFLVTGAYTAGFLFESSLVSEALDLVAALLAAAGTWHFARPYVRFDDAGVEAPTVGDPTGGFESAGDD